MRPDPCAIHPSRPDIILATNPKIQQHFLGTKTGILIIFIWRLLAKSFLHTVLPPVFRELALHFELPHRRFYTPATDYGRLPVENGLHPIPSVIDLASTLEVSGVNGSEQPRQAIKRRGLNLNGGNAKMHGGTGTGASLEGGGSSGTDKMGVVATREVKHYDADGGVSPSCFTGLGYAEVLT